MQTPRATPAITTVWSSAALGVLLTALWSTSALADVPKRLHYQGYLTNAVGNPIHCPNVLSCTESYSVVFRLYDSEYSTSSVWEETHAAVPINEGVFHVLLGTQSNLEATDLSGPRWLGLAINGGDEMLPRQELVSAAYALYAEQAKQAEQAETANNATQLGGNAATDYSLKSDLSAAGTLNASNNPVDWTQLKGVPSDVLEGGGG